MEFSREQELLRQVVSGYLKDKSPPESVRELMASERGYDPAIWSEICGEIGMAVHLPESHGGSGLGAVELGIVCEEMGRYLYCGPFFASAVMAGYALMEVATGEHRDTLLPAVASGEGIATLVLDSLDAPERIGRQVEADADGRPARQRPDRARRRPVARPLELGSDRGARRTTASLRRPRCRSRRRSPAGHRARIRTAR